jgi:hypothetical protein
MAIAQTTPEQMAETFKFPDSEKELSTLAYGVRSIGERLFQDHAEVVGREEFDEHEMAVDVPAYYRVIYGIEKRALAYKAEHGSLKGFSVTIRHESDPKVLNRRDSDYMALSEGYMRILNKSLHSSYYKMKIAGDTDLSNLGIADRGSLEPCSLGETFALTHVPFENSNGKLNLLVVYTGKKIDLLDRK